MSIADELTRLQNAKASIKLALENKGVNVPSNANLSEYPTLINMIESSGVGINGVTSTYKVKQGENIQQGDFVSINVNPSSYKTTDYWQVIKHTNDILIIGGIIIRSSAVTQQRSSAEIRWLQYVDSAWQLSKSVDLTNALPAPENYEYYAVVHIGMLHDGKFIITYRVRNLEQSAFRIVQCCATFNSDGSALFSNVVTLFSDVDISPCAVYDVINNTLVLRFVESKEATYNNYHGVACSWCDDNNYLSVKKLESSSATFNVIENFVVQGGFGYDTGRAAVLSVPMLTEVSSASFSRSGSSSRYMPHSLFTSNGYIYVGYDNTLYVLYFDGTTIKFLQTTRQNGQISSNDALCFNELNRYVFATKSGYSERMCLTLCHFTSDGQLYNNPALTIGYIMSMYKTSDSTFTITTDDYVRFYKIHENSIEETSGEATILKHKTGLDIFGVAVTNQTADNEINIIKPN